MNKFDYVLELIKIGLGAVPVHEINRAMSCYDRFVNLRMNQQVINIYPDSALKMATDYISAYFDAGTAMPEWVRHIEG